MIKVQVRSCVFPIAPIDLPCGGAAGEIHEERLHCSHHLPKLPLGQPLLAPIPMEERGDLLGLAALRQGVAAGGRLTGFCAALCSSKT